MSKSPNGTHTAVLHYGGEIRFGPEYHELSIDSYLLKGKLFGSVLAWSQDSRYLAAQEWLTTDYGTGPITRAVIFDLARSLYAPLKKTDKGFAQDFIFRGEAFIYKKHFHARGEVVEVELNLTDIRNWQEFGS
ncbi:hypothetical protein [Pseudomonas sp.]|uniref:hypothetical protein n=1 Tax=Pseudomonas sp. TaxID=306 RepID=UPI00299DAEF8|nr:hypothetical protein [Pseudomonas sp.]MDX1366815.1 hypothetical protein [Pseudomonas sp.]